MELNADSILIKEQEIVDRLTYHNKSKVPFSDTETLEIQDIFNDVYQSYIKLIQDNKDKLVSLKHALFLQWYGWLEPFQVSGAGDKIIDYITGTGTIGKEQQYYVLETVEKALQDGWADEELIWMLYWYNAITSWYFNEYRFLPNIAKLIPVEKEYTEIDLQKHLLNTTLSSPGMLGHYFNMMEHGLRKRKGRELAELKFFWGNLWSDDLKPFSLLERTEVLKQLKKQFGINPFKWKYVGNSGEGHWLPLKDKEDTVENSSGDIVNVETGKEISLWIDWISDCEEESEERSNACMHDSPSTCGIRFFVEHFNKDWYGPDGKVSREPFHGRWWRETYLKNK